MNRYINVDKLIEFANNTKDKTIDANDIARFPAADVRENVKAHWIDMKPTGDSRFMCSRCRCKEKVPTIMGVPIVWGYCPNCGAEMEKSLAMNKKTNAEWICLGHRMGFCKHPDSVDYKCSNCGYEEYTLFFPPSDKCPNCGARMKL